MVPDCIGMTESVALRLLASIGMARVEVVVTRPPRGGYPVGEARVVRQRNQDLYCELVVAYKEYLEHADFSHRN